MKSIHKKLYEYFDEINDFYKARGMKLMASAGTLLGAIRDKGIIEWDDDIDLEILESDEQKFLKIAEELQNSKGWICYYHEPNDGYKFKDIKGNEIPVDIFVLRSTIQKINFFKKIKINLILLKIIKKDSINSFRNKKVKFIAKLLKPIAYLLIQGNKSYKDLFNEMYDANSQYLAEISSLSMRQRTIIEKDKMKKIDEITFGNTNIFVSKYASERLTKSYGDWETPKIWDNHGNE